jgi:predicted dithiol-disulfide oxidoreductase (DUF899 family)
LALLGSLLMQGWDFVAIDERAPRAWLQPIIRQEDVMTDQPESSFPRVVSRREWQEAREALLLKEKAHTRAQDALAAERRRMPMVRIDKSYSFEGSNGRVRLADLFDARRQLIIYHFMYAPGLDGNDDTDGWPDAGCPGCSMFVDNLPHLAHLHARDTSFCLISRGPFPNLERYRRRMGWEIPWYSSAGTSFNQDFGVTTSGGEIHGLSVLLRKGQELYQTYFTTGRGVESPTVWNLLDWTPFGRQETWEVSPLGWPQTEPFVWWRRHDEY